MNKIPMSIRVGDGLMSQLDQMANATGRDRSWHVRQAVSRYLAAELAQTTAPSKAGLEAAALRDRVLAIADGLRSKARVMENPHGAKYTDPAAVLRAAAEELEAAANE